MGSLLMTYRLLLRQRGSVGMLSNTGIKILQRISWSYTLQTTSAIIVYDIKNLKN